MTRHVLPSDRAPDRPESELKSDKLGDAASRARLGSIRKATPEEYVRLGLLAVDHVTDQHPADSPEATAAAAELLGMLGLLDDNRLYAVRRVRRAEAIRRAEVAP